MGDDEEASTEPEPRDSREARQLRIHKQSMQSFEQNARLAERMKMLPKVSVGRI